MIVTMNKNIFTFVGGYIATENREPFLGQIKINNKTGLIEDVIEGEELNADYVYNQDNLIFAGMGDIHIHAREDQTGEQKYKEDYETAGNAALNGGCVHVSAMPNTPKPLTTEKDFDWHRKRIADLAHPVSILNYIGIDRKTKPIGEPGEHFYKCFFGKSIGDLTVQYAFELDEILSKYKGHNISFHVEYEPIIKASISGKTHSERRPFACVIEGLLLLLPLIEKYKIKAKLCHWSIGGKSFELVREYRNRGCQIEVEVSPLHLLFDTSNTDKNSELWLKIQMNPAIRTPKHRNQLIEGLKTGFIQYLATDHAPHTEEEKYGAFSKFKDEYSDLTNVEIGAKIKNENLSLYYETCNECGMSGAPWLDTYGLVCAYLMNEHGFDTRDIARIASYNPGKFINSYLKQQFPNKNYGKGFGKIEKGFVGSLTILNLEKKTIIKREDLKTKSRWSPLEDREMLGSIEAVFIAGELMDKF